MRWPMKAPPGGPALAVGAMRPVVVVETIAAFSVAALLVSSLAKQADARDWLGRRRSSERGRDQRAEQSNEDGEAHGWNDDGEREDNERRYS